MHIIQSCCGGVRSGLERRRLTSHGLGSNIDKEYSTQSQTGQTVNMVLGMNPLMAVANIVPKGLTKAAGIDVNPISVFLAPLTGGLTLIPGLSKVIGNVFGGLFKKATHMGDCMKWFANEENLRGSIGGTQPLPFDFIEYMKKNFPQFMRQYQVMQAGGQWASVGIDKLVSASNRRARLMNEFAKIVRANPDLMTLQCAVQHSHETGYKDFTQAQVTALWKQVHEAAQQKEYASLVPEVDKRIAPFKAKETWGEIVRSRDRGLLVGRSEGVKLAMPPNVTGVKRGALQMTLKSEQTSLKPVKFK